MNLSTGLSWASVTVMALLAACGNSSDHNGGGDGGSALGQPPGLTLTGGGSSGSSGGGDDDGGSSYGDDTGSSTSTSSYDAGSRCSDGGAGSFPAVSGGGVVFSVNMCKGPARQFDPPSTPVAVSPYVYGVNQFAAWESTTKWGALRWGGDAFTSWNWTNDYSNSGSDYCFWQGAEGKGTGLAATIGGTTYPSVGTANSHGSAALVTVPILDHVSSSAVTNNVWSGSSPPCPGSPSCASANGYASNVGNLDFVSVDSSSHAFVANSATKSTALCTCAGTGCGSACAVNTTGAVYENEFVNYMKVTYGSSGAPIFFSLDNEPNYWPGTHPELWPYTGTPGCGTSGTVTFAQIVSYDTTYATAIKATWPEAKVFGPVVAQDGIIYAGDYSDPNLPGTVFTQYYLEKMAAASVAAGHALLDSYDVHYYTSNGSTAQCVQVPRMFWDPNFTDFTAAATDSIDYGWAGKPNAMNVGYFDANLYPRQMIPRLQKYISAAYSGTGASAPGLSFSEYDPGCEGSIEGGVAEADLLGIFGREGVYAATAWPLKTIANGTALANYVVAAFDLYRNYDAKGSTVGDTTVYAQTSNVENSSVYAFSHSEDPSEVEVVAINKTNAALPVTFQISGAPSLTKATAYDLVNSSSTIGVTAAAGAAPAITCTGTDCVVTYTLPSPVGATGSATTIVLR